MVRRNLTLLAITITSAFALGVWACAGGEELNPQPLPPGPPDRGDTPGESTGEGSSSGFTPTPGAGDSSDAGTKGDAADTDGSDAAGDAGEDT